MWWTALVGRLERATALDPVTTAAQKASGVLLPPGAVKDALHGTWLGHPVHPLLVALPIGMWSGASLLDLTGGDRTASRRLVAAGVLAVLPTALTGLADWSELGQDARPKRVGLVHAVTNYATAGVYAASWLARRRGDQARGRDLALLGLAGLGVSGYLGGHLAYGEGVGVNRNADVRPTPEQWTDAGAASDLAEGALHRADVDGAQVLLSRSGGHLYGIGAVCSHLAAPLEDGELTGPGTGDCVVCPWHGSTFRLSDGAIERGPATAPQPAYDVRERAGRVQVRARATGAGS